MRMQRYLSVILAALLVTYATGPAARLRAQATLANTTIRPFVTGIIPVVGDNGAVGGVAVDAKGVVKRVNRADAKLADVRTAAFSADPGAALRCISLARLEKAFAEQFAQNEPIPEEMLFLAGLQRVEYVFADPDSHDILLAGPAEPWRVGEDGMAIGVSTGKPTLRLDDLLEAFRTAEIAVEGQGITCSIEPTAEGLARLERLLRDRDLRWNSRTAASMKKAIGPQQVLVTGVLPDSHFARVMVAADYLMKRLAMGLEPSPIEDMPSYLELLKAKQDAAIQTASPRFWMAVHYEPLVRSEDGLAWQIRGPGVKVMSEDAFLASSGERVASAETDAAAVRWADTMTKRYEELSTALPVFGQLRNCMDLAVVAALISHHDLLAQVGADWPMLTSGRQARGPQYPVPTYVDSQISVIQSENSFLIGISGGVDLDSWSVLEQTKVNTIPVKMPVAARGTSKNNRWWW